MWNVIFNYAEADINIIDIDHGFAQYLSTEKPLVDHMQKYGDAMFAEVWAAFDIVLEWLALCMNLGEVRMLFCLC